MSLWQLCIFHVFFQQQKIKFSTGICEKRKVDKNFVLCPYIFNVAMYHVFTGDNGVKHHFKNEALGHTVMYILLRIAGIHYAVGS